MEKTMSISYLDIDRKNELNEIRLIKESMKGNKESFGILIKNNKEYLYKMAFLYVKDEQDALEVIHETVYRAFLNIEKLKKAKFFNTWITRILINVSIDFLKKKGKNEMLDESTPIRKERCEISTEEKLDLYNAIDLLNDNYKTVIIMMYFNDMKIKDISKVMEIPENTVKTYLRRAKQALGEVLKEGYLNE
ncbi:sigma-70 family RNA polymerase sigma factor [Clostridium perfringens]|uniref:RNA polymerase ECF-type sigma factor n=1 Tax=Clostridium perfringens (strain 13 / Type A) TaxID=195102 RepID=Q8XMX9_CLOPE|nr:sigma-70 family RNA polymerase sigma factor [Clostridium perfringens]MBI5986783.1 sigma-70 family RNA polymerase sigma factor [Clostridium perfringens]MBI6053726.1 sigma-70 family RNA polymerase sigma factor [Clostridium perfringens]MBO3335189.1 sigma-70 family RNA polymerase sigma factor [Clostridium perfringens]MDB2051449.1 sigma-70 family RNA polymerase sigma factor [Clostridium perfringens]MDB2068641.1 sigma-70 family RNA polymerase sigma factor [Clostridium perfringens]